MQENFPVVPTTPATPAVFLFEDFQVRTILIAGEPWFVAKDVADILGYVNQRKAIRMHCKHAKPVGGTETDLPHDFDPQTVIIQEGDVYRLIVRSEMPVADEFEQWLMEEVLPSIRKHGHYSVAPVKQLPVSTDPLDLFLITSNAIQQIKAETDARIANVEEEIQDMKNSQPVLNHQRYSIQKAVGEKVQQLSEKHQIAYRPILFSATYGFIKRYFRVPTYSAIPSIRFEEALTIIKNLVLEQLPENVIAMAKGGAA